jgi:DNA-binding response OmpR family regulator
MTPSQADLPVETILIVDDAPDTLRFLSKLLTQQGYKTRRVINGQLALESARLEPPDLVLLDIMMPGMNGYEVCKRLRQDDRTRHIPVIFLSALDEELDKVQAFQVGGVDYVTKPFQVMEVMARVGAHLSLSRTKQQLQAVRQQLEQETNQRLAIETAFQILNEQVEAMSLMTDRSSLNGQADLAALETALTDALTLSQLRGDLLATIVQDLQLPLVVIANAASLLIQTPASSSALHRVYLKMIAASVQKIFRLFEAIQLSETDPSNANSANTSQLD